MIAHRLQTHTVPEPPVRVYRIIALTFLAVTIILLGVVIFTMLKKTEITIVAEEDAKTVNLIVAVEAQKTAEKSIIGIVTSTQFYWSEKYTPTATREVDGTTKGEVIIYNKTNETQPLVATTRLLTTDGKLYRLTNRVIVPANGQTTAAVYADQSGAAFDIGPTQFTIPGLSTEKQKVIYAESAAAFAGGSGKVGIVSEADYKSAQADFAEKTKQSYLNSINSAFPNFDTKITSIPQSNATSSRSIGDEASEFTISGTSTIIVVAYNAADLQAILKNEVEKNVDTASEKVLSIGTEPKVTVASTDLVNNTAQIQVACEAIVTLDANAPLLNKENFLNKQKSEIERYIVALPHVSNMTIDFTPSWISKAPSVADKLKIVVKSVK
jgi:hypothetical protein